MMPLASRSSTLFAPVALATAVLGVGCPLPSSSIGDLADTSSTTGMSGDPDAGPSTAPTDDGESGRDTDSTSTGSDPTNTTASPETSTASESTGVGTECAADLPPSTDDACNVNDQDCPACYRCTWTKTEGIWATNQEQPVCLLAPEDGRALGEACTVDAATGNDDCAIGSFCYPGPIEDYEPRCISFCEAGEEFTCAVPDTYCVGSSSAGTFGCLQACDPLAPNCGVSEFCQRTYPTGDGFACYPSSLDPEDLVGVMGECTSSFECMPGLVCTSHNDLGDACTGSGCCAPLCDSSDPGANAECQAIDPAFECVSGCEFGSPPDYPTLGACIVNEPVPGVCEPPGIDDTYPWCSWQNDDACHDPGHFGAGGTCNDYCHCYVPCDDASECAVPPTGDATPACRQGEVGESNSCVLECDDGQTCPDGMACSDMYTPSLCMWPTPNGGDGC